MNSLRAYFYLMRLHRPLPILLLLWPAFWALWVASKGVPKIEYILIFACGVFLVRTAGCIFNDIADRNFDGAVERTKMRPLATGEISVKHAVILACILCLIAFALVLLLNELTVLLSFVAIGLTLFYPLCKRFFSIPQLVLGLAFNFGVVMAFSTVQDQVPILAWIIYASAILWTLAYDTIYALADLPYDQKLGLHSSAVFFGRYVMHAIFVLQGCMIVLLIFVGVLQGYNWLFYISLAVSLIFFGYQFSLYHSKELKKCIRAFSNNHWVGMVIFIGIIMQYPVLR